MGSKPFTKMPYIENNSSVVILLKIKSCHGARCAVGTNLSLQNLVDVRCKKIVQLGIVLFRTVTFFLLTINPALWNSKQSFFGGNLVQSQYLSIPYTASHGAQFP